MAGLAYLLLPITGLVAYLRGRDARTRFHGAQAIALGLLWPLCLYAAALGPPLAVQVVFGAGLLIWVVFLIATALGRDPTIPGAARYLRLAVSTAAPRSTSGSSSRSSR